MLAGIFLATAAVTSLPAQPTNAPATRPAPLRLPNIIFILADGLGYGDLGSYGQRNIQTPNLDRLAEGGARFTSFYAGSPDKSASRAAFLLGRHGGHLSSPTNALDTATFAASPTLAEILKQRGYHTVCIGEWAMPGAPHQRGFDEWAGLLAEGEAQNFFPPYISRFDPATPFDGKVVFGENEGSKKGKLGPDIFTTAAKNFIKINKPDQCNQFRPMFLFLGYNLPRNGTGLPDSTPYNTKPWPAAEKQKATAIALLDDYVGQIVDQLKAFKQESNTVIVVASDGGPRLDGGVDAKFHRSAGGLKLDPSGLGEGNLRVPLIVSWPGTIRPGNVISQPWAAWDILPTLADISGATMPDKLDGISVLPSLAGQSQTNRHEFLYWEQRASGFQQAARMKDWKALKAKPGKPAEIFSLAADFAEKTNLAAEQPETLKQLEEFLRTFPAPAAKAARAH